MCDEKKAQMKWKFVPGFIRWNRLKMLRKLHEMRQIDLASACDVSVTSIFFLETGGENRVSVEIKEQIADFFKIPVSEIFPAEMQGDKVIATGERIKMQPFDGKKTKK